MRYPLITCGITAVVVAIVTLVLAGYIFLLGFLLLAVVVFLIGVVAVGALIVAGLVGLIEKTIDHGRKLVNGEVL